MTPIKDASKAAALTKAVPCGRGTCKWVSLNGGEAYRCDSCGTGMTLGWLERSTR